MKNFILLLFLISCGERNSLDESCPIKFELRDIISLNNKKLAVFSPSNGQTCSKLVGYDLSVLKFNLTLSAEPSHGKLSDLFLGSLAEGRVEEMLLTSGSLERVNLTPENSFTGPIERIDDFKISFEFIEDSFDYSLLPRNVILEMRH
jgi:hypothetical protein